MKRRLPKIKQARTTFSCCGTRPAFRERRGSNSPRGENAFLACFLSLSDFSFVLIKKGQILYQSKSQGLKPLIFCLKHRKKELKGAVVFDKIVGRAAALLLVLSQVKTVITPLVSQKALDYLRKNKVRVLYERKARHILNKKKDDFCPMEKLSRGKTAEELLKILSECG